MHMYPQTSTPLPTRTDTHIHAVTRTKLRKDCTPPTSTPHTCPHTSSPAFICPAPPPKHKNPTCLPVFIQTLPRKTHNLYPPVSVQRLLYHCHCMSHTVVKQIINFRVDDVVHMLRCGANWVSLVGYHCAWWWIKAYVWNCHTVKKWDKFGEEGCSGGSPVAAT